jgi:hypothetical protein
MGLDTYLQRALYTEQVHALIGFAAQVRHRGFGQRQRIQAGTVACAIAAMDRQLRWPVATTPQRLVKAKNSSRDCSKHLINGKRRPHRS